MVLALHSQSGNLRAKNSDVLSQEFLGESGVPQGSPLSPLLFLCFINDIGRVIQHSSFLLFADDLKLFRLITSEKECKLLQEDLNNVSELCITNEMHFNINKCQIMRCTLNQSLKMLGYIKRSLNDLNDIQAIKTVCTTHVRNKMEYSTMV